MSASLNPGLSPEVTYALKGNIAYPGTQAQATAAEAKAQSRLNDSLPAKVAVTVSAGAIPVAS